MSELLFTQAEFDNYIDTIDKNNAANIKALSSIQILAPRLFNDLMYLLITGRVTLTQLTAMSINNSTIQNLVDSIFSTPTTIAEKSIFYREMLLSLTGLNAFMTQARTDSLQYLASKRISNSSFATMVVIDSLGIAPNTYKNLQAAKAVYNSTELTHSVRAYINALTISPSVTPLSIYEVVGNSTLTYSYDISSTLTLYINNVYVTPSNYTIHPLSKTIEFDTLFVVNPTDVITVSYETTNFTLSTLSLDTVKAFTINDILQYKFMYTPTEDLPLDISPDEIASGFIFRKLYNYIPYINLKENMNWLVNEMGTDYSLDTLHNGVFTINRLLEVHTWNSLDSTLTFNEFMNRLARIYFLRVTVLGWYGVIFPTGVIQKEKNNYAVISSFLELIRVELELFTSQLKIDLNTF